MKARPFILSHGLSTSSIVTFLINIMRIMLTASLWTPATIIRSPLIFTVANKRWELNSHYIGNPPGGGGGGLGGCSSLINSLNSSLVIGGNKSSLL